MALIDLFRNCGRCNKSGLFTKLNKEGYCAECAAKRKEEQAAKLEKEREEILKKIYHTPSVNSDSCVNQPQSFNFPMKADEKRASEIRRMEYSTRHWFTPPAVLDGCVMVYRYPNVSVKIHARHLLEELFIAEEFRVELQISESNDVIIKSKFGIIGTVLEKDQIIKDWKKRGDPMICEFVTFASGQESIALFLYRDDESRFLDREKHIVKLTSCMSASKQEAIECLTKNEKLFIDLDDYDKLYVKDISNYPIGNLPAKYKKLYDAGTIDAVYFDHSEIIENDSGIEKEIPFVRIYTS